MACPSDQTLNEDISRTKLSQELIQLRWEEHEILNKIGLFLAGDVVKNIWDFLSKNYFSRPERDKQQYSITVFGSDVLAQDVF